MLTATRVFQPSAQLVARRLPEVHAALYRGLMVLLPDDLARCDQLVSRVGDDTDLYLEIIERHDYTTFIRLTHLIGSQREHNPNAHVRIYHDAHVAEATAYSPLQGVQRLAGPELSINGVLMRGWRMNRALLKWLDHLLLRGHGPETMMAQ